MSTVENSDVSSCEMHSCIGNICTYMWEVDKNYACVRELPLGDRFTPPPPLTSGPCPHASVHADVQCKPGGWRGPTRAGRDALKQGLWGASRRDVTPGAGRWPCGSAWVWSGHGHHCGPLNLMDALGTHSVVFLRISYGCTSYFCSESCDFTSASYTLP